MNRNKNLNNFFYPKTVAVVGASSKEKSIGYELLKSIYVYGYKGKIFPVNPKADEILGFNCFKTISEINENIDLAIIIVPKQFVIQSIGELLEKGCKSIILITAGFKETGEEGAAIEKQIAEKIKAAGARLVGPNCMGCISTIEDIKLNATFVAEKPQLGYTGFVSQSGGLAAAILNLIRTSNVRFAHFISVGNKADLNENDFIQFWENDDNIKTITLYLESFSNGEELLKILMTEKVTKPIIILKAGKFSHGMKAASSHTGALASKDKVVDAVLNQFGAIRVQTVNELFNTALAFENFPIPKGNRIALITNAGGPGVIAVDKIEEKKLVMAQLSDDTKSKLREVVHPEGSINNPIDLLPAPGPESYKIVCEILLADENVDAVIAMFIEPVMLPANDIIKNLLSIKSEKPIYKVFLPLPEFWDYYEKEYKNVEPIFKQPEDPAEFISNIFFYKNGREKIKKCKSEYENLLQIANSKFCNSINEFLNQEEINTLVKEYDIPIVKSAIINKKEISKISEEMYPIVLKGIHEKAIHKSEFNAVALNIKGQNELEKEIDKMETAFAQKGLKLEKYLIQQFIEPKFEILIGGFRDANFGPMIMFGAGGKYVEVVDDTCMKSAYISDIDIDEMIDSTKIGTILKGVRGENPCDINQIKKLISSTAKMLVEHKNIIEFDFNPILISKENKIFAVDIRIKIKLI